MPARILILNGPNLNLLGEREPEIYGRTTLASVEAACKSLAKDLGVSVTLRQTNHEGEMVDWIQAARKGADAIVINPASFSFTSIAMIDALKMFDGPIIELHISNIHGRDELHRHSKVSAGVKAVICGLGVYGYPVALQCAAQMLGVAAKTLPKALRKAPA